MVISLLPHRSLGIRSLFTPQPVERRELEDDAPDPQAFIAVWARGFTKSTQVELALVYLGVRGDSRDPRLIALEADPIAWLREFFPEYVGLGTHGRLTEFASYHVEFWDWVKQIRGPRKYAIYVSDTQEQAEGHLENIAAMLTSERFSQSYPQHAERYLTKFGQARGWRRTRLYTKGGFTMDAAGLDKGIRGSKRDANRPRVIAFDDLDRENDSPAVTQRKIRNLTRSIIPTQGPGCAFMGAQNLVIKGGIFTQLADGTADFLTKRRVSGPHPALRNFDPETHLEGRADGGWDIIGGIPTWDEMPIPRVQRLLDTGGRESFLIECQHMLSEQSGLVFKQFDPEVHEWRHAALPPFVAYYGGIDFGGEGDTAHNSTLTLMGMTAGKRLVLVEEWYGNGANVADRQVAEMYTWEGTYGRVRWEQDGDERTFFQVLRKHGFDVIMSRRHGGSKKDRIRRFGRLLTIDGSGRPSFYYVRKCRRFRHEIERWSRPPSIPGVPHNDDPIAVDDDVLVSALYAAERAEIENEGTMVGRVSVKVA